MIGQIQIVDCIAPHISRIKILEAKNQILKNANDQDPLLVSLGGGAKDINVKVIQGENSKMVIAELIVDCKDAMGANAVNTMTEAVSPLIEKISGGKVSGCIFVINLFDLGGLDFLKKSGYEVEYLIEFPGH